MKNQNRVDLTVQSGWGSRNGKAIKLKLDAIGFDAIQEPSFA